MSGWPNRRKRGVPFNPERDDWHWLDIPGNPPQPYQWLSAEKGWLLLGLGCQGVICHLPKKTRYLGPCLTPSEVAALPVAVAGIVSSMRVEMADGFRLAAKVALAALEPSDGVFYSASASSDLRRAHYRVKQKLEEAAEAWDINMEEKQ